MAAVWSLQDAKNRFSAVVADLWRSGSDLLIAATALEYGLTVVTRNLGHFTPTHVPTVNPWSEAIS